MTRSIAPEVEDEVDVQEELEGLCREMDAINWKLDHLEQAFAASRDLTEDFIQVD